MKEWRTDWNSRNLKSSCCGGARCSLCVCVWNVYEWLECFELTKGFGLTYCLQFHSMPEWGAAFHCPGWQIEQTGRKTPLVSGAVHLKERCKPPPPNKQPSFQNNNLIFANLKSLLSHLVVSKAGGRSLKGGDYFGRLGPIAQNYF